MRLILKEVDGRVPVIVSTGHTGTDVAVALSRQAEAEGADALMILPPYFLKPDADGVFEYFRAIDQAVGIPIMVQDAPLMTQVAIGPALLARMARELEHLRYAKIEAPPTAPKITEVRRAAGDDLVLFGGLNGQFLFEELGRGARGTMPGSDLTAVFATVVALVAGRPARRGARRVRAAPAAHSLRTAAGARSVGDEAEPVRVGHHRDDARPPSHAHAGRDRVRGARRPQAHARPDRCTPACPTRV